MGDSYLPAYECLWERLSLLLATGSGKQQQEELKFPHSELDYYVHFYSIPLPNGSVLENKLGGGGGT